MRPQDDISIPFDLARQVTETLTAHDRDRERSLEMAEKARGSFREFLKMAWPIMEPSRKFVAGWHLDAVTEHLQAVHERKIKNLLITISPGTAKSLVTSVAWPAWIWTRDPGFRSIFSSYDAGLSTRDSIRCRELMQSIWYQETFEPTWKFSTVQNEKTYYTNTSTGFRVSTSVGGKATGWRASGLVCDDPVNIKDEFSDAVMEEAVRWWENVMFNRLDNMETGVKVVIMQRISDRDLAGHILRSGGYEHLMIPNEYEPDRSKVTSLGWRDPRTVRGELMCPELLSRAVTDAIKKNPGRYEGQYMQNPHPMGSGILKPHLWNYWKPAGLRLPPVRVRMPGGEIEEREAVELPSEFDMVVQSWDCLDSQTEILTKNGWRGRGQVAVDDMVYSLNTSSQKMELVPVTEYGERPVRDGEKFVCIDSRMAEPRVTEGHRLYIGVKNRRGIDNQWITAGELVERNKKYRLPLSAECDFPGLSLTDDELKFIAWFLTDGGFAGTPRTYVRISQAKEYKHEIRALLKRLKMDFLEKTTPPCKKGFRAKLDMTEFFIPKGNHHVASYKRNGWVRLAHWLDKDIVPEFRLLTKRQFKVFWDELMKGDGDLSNGYLCTPLRCVADRIQELAVVRGFSTCAHSRPSTSGKIMWYVAARERASVESNPRLGPRVLWKEDPIPGEIVWCVQNQNETLVTRRNGKVCIIGNCSFKDLKDSDFVAGGVVASHGPNRYILEAVHGRMDVVKTVQAVREMSGTGWGAKAHLKLIEDKANGSAVIQMLKGELSGLVPVQPEGGKVSRARAAAYEQSTGNWFLPHPTLKEWVGNPADPSAGGGFIQECSAFPNGANDDYVDMWSQSALRIISERDGAIYKSRETDIAIPIHDIPRSWQRVYGLCVTWDEIAAVWMARDPESKNCVIHDLYWAIPTDPATHVAAIREKGAWIPGVISAVETGRERRDGYMLAEKYVNLGLKLDATPEMGDTTAMVDVNNALNQGKLKVFGNLAKFFDQYRMYRRDPKGKLPLHNVAVMKALETVWQWGHERLRTEPGEAIPVKPMEVGRSIMDGGGGWMAG